MSVTAKLCKILKCLSRSWSKNTLILKCNPKHAIINEWLGVADCHFGVTLAALLLMKPDIEQS